MKYRRDLAYHSGVADVGYDTLTIVVSTAGLLWLFVRQTNRQIDALRADFTKQFEAQRAETAALRADTARQFEALRADFTKQFEAQRADTARQFEALRVEHREGLAQVGERVAELRADFRAVLPRAAAEPVDRPQAPVVVAPQRRADQPPPNPPGQVPAPDR